MAAPNEITPAQLARLIGTPDCPPIVDVCLDADFDADPYLIPGSVRHEYDDLAGLEALLRGAGRGIIVCQKGLKLSQGVAAWLRASGIAAEYLQGGVMAWRALPGAMSLPALALPAPPSLWVTRHRPKIDRIACPWLIRRFVDREARFLYVAPDQVAAVAERFGAVPFDVEGAALGHVDGRCSFDAMLGAFGLKSPALEAMAQVIRAADTGRMEAAPQAAGLLALSVGLSKQYRDDAAQLEAGLALYDALFRWARDGQEETHASLGEARP